MLAGRERLRAKLSYTNIGFALAPETFTISELSAIYTAALGYPSTRQTCAGCSSAAACSRPTGERRTPGREGGRAGGGLPVRARASSR